MQHLHEFCKSYSKSNSVYLGYYVLNYLSTITGTGSGVGTNVLGLLEDNFPEVYRFTTAVYPSVDDDVITSPYNRYCFLNFVYFMLVSVRKTCCQFYSL